MRRGIFISVSAADRRRLEAVVADRNTPQKHVWRARIILLTADGSGTNGIMAATGRSKTTVWRWQERFMVAGVEGLLQDKTRPPGKAPIDAARVEEVVRRTLAPPPHEATHWTARAMAAACGLAVSTIQSIWKAHGLAPHRWRSFKLSTDPAFAEKLHDIVGLYVDPPAHAVALSVDEKSQIQALDRTQPGLPMKKGRLGTMTHDYKRHGTTTLFAALNVLDGTVIGRNMAATGIRSSSASSTRSSARSRRTRRCTRSSTTTPRTRPRRCGAGWHGTRAGPSTSPRPRAPG
jgi:transposase